MVTGCPVLSCPLPCPVPCPAMLSACRAQRCWSPLWCQGCPVPAALPGDAVQVPRFALRSDARFPAECLHHSSLEIREILRSALVSSAFYLRVLAALSPAVLPSSLLQSYLGFFLVLEIIGFWKSKSQALQIPPSQEN